MLVVPRFAVNKEFLLLVGFPFVRRPRSFYGVTTKGVIFPAFVLLRKRVRTLALYSLKRGMHVTTAGRYLS